MIDRSRKGTFEPDQMGPPFVGIDVIGKREEVLCIPVIILEGNFDLYFILEALDVDGFRMDTVLIFIEVFDEGEDPSFVKKIVPLF